MQNAKRDRMHKIHIKPSHEGMLHDDLGVPRDQKIPLEKEEELKEHGTPAQKKRAVFAINFRK